MKEKENKEQTLTGKTITIACITIIQNFTQHTISKV